jgi:hypothetical protein
MRIRMNCWKHVSVLAFTMMAAAPSLKAQDNQQGKCPAFKVCGYAFPKEDAKRTEYPLKINVYDFEWDHDHPGWARAKFSNGSTVYFPKSEANESSLTIALAPPPSEKKYAQPQAKVPVHKEGEKNTVASAPRAEQPIAPSPSLVPPAAEKPSASATSISSSKTDEHPVAPKNDRAWYQSPWVIGGGIVGLIAAGYVAHEMMNNRTTVTSKVCYNSTCTTSH